MNNFADVYLCEFIWSEEDVAAKLLADRYNNECESFDRLVCSQVDARGVAIPSSHHELAAINRNAINVWIKIKSECEQSGIDFNIVRKFISKGECK